LGLTLALAVGCVLATAPPAAAQTVKIKLATQAPTGSSYHKSLLALREAWRKAASGSVDLVIYPDGKLGSESDTVGLMSLNSVQAAMVTAVGLGEIENGVSGLQSIPMGFHTLEEVDYVGEKLQPLLEQRLLKKGFVVLFWVDAGWVRFFSRKPVVVPNDLKKLKLFSWAGYPEQVEIYQSAGFNPVSLETADILPGLQTGLIEAVPAPPVFANATQIDTRAPHMLELNWAPLVGACIVRRQTWDKIPAATRDPLRQLAAKTGKDIRETGRKESDEAVQAMRKRGLKVTSVTPAIEAEWRAAAEAVYSKIRGKIVPEDIFDAALGYIKEYRARPAR